MASECTLNNISAEALQLPKLKIPHPERISGEPNPPDKCDLKALQECFSPSTPFGNKLKPPMPVDSPQGCTVWTLKLSTQAINIISTLMAPIEVVTKVIEPIATVLKALDGESDPVTIVEKLVELGEELLTLLATLTDTYPVILLLELIQMIKKLCEVLSELKTYLQTVITSVKQSAQNLKDASKAIQKDIDAKIQEDMDAITEAVTDYLEIETDISDDYDDFVDTLEDLKESAMARLTHIVGGTQQLVEDGYASSVDEVVSPAIKDADKQIHNVILGDPSDPKTRGVRGPIQSYYKDQKNKTTSQYTRWAAIKKQHSDAQKEAIKNARERMSADIDQIEDCFKSLLDDLLKVFDPYLTNSQSLVDNVVNGSIDMIAGAIEGILIPIVGALPQCE